MVRIHAIQTGRVKVRQAQRVAKGRGVARIANMLFDPEWTEWLPVFAWAIELGDKVVLVDTGETARVHERGYHPSWHPFYRRAVRFEVAPGDEVGPQLHEIGIDPRDISLVILTHLHTDHAGGLRHVVGSRCLVHAGELRRAQGLAGRLNGYLPQRWPRFWLPEAIQFDACPVGPFEQSAEVTGTGEILIIPTPGHTPGHVSVLVQGSPSVLLAGDATYEQDLLMSDKVDGVTMDEAAARRTLGNIRDLARERPLVCLPSHDPGCVARLENQSILVSCSRVVPSQIDSASALK